MATSPITIDNDVDNDSDIKNNAVHEFSLSEVLNTISPHEDNDDNFVKFHQTVYKCKYTFGPSNGSIALSKIRKNFDEYLNQFLAYIRTHKPDVHTEYVYIMGQFLRAIFKLIAIVIYDKDVKNNEIAEFIIEKLDNIDDATICYDLLYDECRKIFNLTSKIGRKEISPSDWALNTWGRHYWNFLHSLSILVQYTHQTNPKKMALDYYAAVMLNFDIILPCSICSQNYVKKRPLKSVSLQIIYSGDAIRTTYDLHNSVRILNDSEIYDYRDFLKDWNLQVDEVKAVDIKSLYYFD